MPRWTRGPAGGAGDDQVPSAELRSYPLWRRRHRELGEAEAFAAWEAAGDRFIARRPGDSLATLNRRFSLLYADGYDEGIHTPPDPRAAQNEARWAAENTPNNGHGERSAASDNRIGFPHD